MKNNKKWLTETDKIMDKKKKSKSGGCKRHEKMGMKIKKENDWRAGKPRDKYCNECYSCLGNRCL